MKQIVAYKCRHFTEFFCPRVEFGKLNLPDQTYLIFAYQTYFHLKNLLKIDSYTLVLRLVWILLWSIKIEILDAGPMPHHVCRAEWGQSILSILSIHLVRVRSHHYNEWSQYIDNNVDHIVNLLYSPHYLLSILFPLSMYWM